MKKAEHGFSAVEALVVLVILGVLATVGVIVHNRGNAPKSSSLTASTTAATSPQGTAESIDSLTAQDASSEEGINNKYEKSDQAAAETTNTAAANLGGAYDDSSF